MTTAFVFAGGGSLGAIQVGMLRALAEAGVRPDLVVGCSVGAINASYFAWSPDLAGVEGLEAVWRKIRRSTIFPFGPLRGLAALLFLSESFKSPRNLRSMLEENLPYERLEQTAIPCHTVATDVVSGTEVLLSSGPAVDALLASAAIPGLFPPVRVDDRLVVDGAVACNTPISVATQLGADHVVVLPAGYSCTLQKQPRSPFAVLSNSLNLVMARQLVVDIERYGEKVRLSVAPPLCPLPVSSGDFAHTEELMKRGEDTTRSWIEAGGLDRSAGPAEFAVHRHRT